MKKDKHKVHEDGDDRRAAISTVFFSILLLAFAVRMTSAILGGDLRNPLRGQPTEEVTLAEGLADGHGLCMPYHLNHVYPDTSPSAHSPPAFPCLLGGGIWLGRTLGLSSLAPHRLVLMLNMLIGALSAAILAMAGANIAGKAGGFAAGLLAACWPTLISGSIQLWDTPYVALGVSLAVWAASGRGRHGGSGGRHFAWGLMAGVLTLFNPLPAPLLLAAPLVRGRGHQLNVRRITLLTVACLAGWAVTISPWVIRNAVHFGELMPVRGGIGIALWCGNQPDCDGTTLSADRFHPMNNPVEQRAVVLEGERKYDRRKTREAKDLVEQNVPAFARKTWRRVGLYWMGDISRPTRIMGATLPTIRGVNLLKLAAKLLVVVCMVAGLFTIKDRAVSYFLLGGLLYMPVVYYVTHVSPNYRVPVDSIILLLCGALAAWIRESARDRFLAGGTAAGVGCKPTVSEP